MTDFAVNRTPLFIAGITFIMELGSKLPWPISGAVSAGLASGLWLAFCDQLFIYTTESKIIKTETQPKTPVKTWNWWWKTKTNKIE